ncbi:MAG: aldehyde ferredoxin oxidoreductase family protein [Candidatus Ranarchaeia archaeon]
MTWFGYSGFYLHVDLTSGSIEKKALPKNFPKQYLGGEGFATKLLYDYTKKGIGPLSPENALVYAIGPLTGTNIPCTSKYAVASKSPLTGFVGYGISSGKFGLEMRLCGLDALVITGKSSKPVFLLIQNDTVEIKDASKVWGKLSDKAEIEIRKMVGNSRLSIACIGPAGENLVRYANINNDLSRQVGRTGMGAVMGSKNLKAIALNGYLEPTVANLQGILDIAPQLMKEGKGKATVKYRVWGTPANVTSLNNLGALPAYNFSKTTFEGAEKISGEVMIRDYLLKNIACAVCPIACDHIVIVEEGEYKGAKASVEYETIMALGSNCGIDSFSSIIRGNELCDELGMDTITAGLTIAWAIECYQKGLIGPKDTDGLELKWNDPKTQHILLKKIAHRDGKFADYLAEGSRRAALKIGKDTLRYAPQVKGLELAGYSPRTLKSMSLGYATSTRGACHLRSGAYSFDIKGVVDRFEGDPSRGKLVSDSEDVYTIYDSVMFCKFFRGVVSTLEDIANLLNLVTGMQFKPEELREIGNRISQLQEAFSIREGLKREDFYLPDRILEEPVPDGPAKGVTLTKQEFEKMLNAYFDYRGWDQNGRPLKQTLQKFGLDEVNGNLCFPK